MDIVNLIPMAGEGSRFKKEGYLLPKPLIPVNGTPMIVHALKSLPKAEKNILIVRKDQIEINDLKKVLDKHFQNIIIIEIDYLTEGQAATCLLAEKEVPNGVILNIGACDVGFEYSNSKYFNTIKKYGAFIWTYNQNPNVLKNPEMYGWVKLLDDNKIDFVSCKKPISKDLINDHVVSGTFTFKDSNLFFQGLNKMIDSEDRVNNEFYLDNIFNHLNIDSGVFKVDSYNSWGTPSELKSYHEKI